MIKIGLRGERANYEPCDELHGAVAWQLANAPTAVEVRLIWFTSGRGSQDVCVADKVRLELLQPEQAHPFQFQLPEAPHSFSGKLISLAWAVEAVVEPADEAARVNFIMAPGGREIVLHEPPFRADPA
jgi:hypothetical protein